MKKHLKFYGLVVFLVYTFFFAADYFAMRRTGSKEACHAWIDGRPYWIHLVMPGPGNACLDKGWWP